MESCVRNICTKNDYNLIFGFQVTVKNVGDVFLRHSVHNDDELLTGKLSVIFYRSQTVVSFFRQGPWDVFFFCDECVLLQSIATSEEDVSGPVSEYSDISFWSFIVNFYSDIANQQFVNALMLNNFTFCDWR